MKTSTQRGGKADAGGTTTRDSLVVGILIACIAIVWVLFFVGGLSEREDLRKDAEDDVSRMSQIVAEQTGGLFGEIRVYLGLMDTWLADNPEVDPRTDPEFLRFVDTLRAHARFRVDLRLVSEDDGLFYIPSADLSSPLAPVGDREYVRAQKDPATRGFYIAEPVKSRVTNIWGIPISYPITRGNGGMAIIFAAVELPDLDTLYETIRPKPTGAITLIRADGVVLCRAPFEERYTGKDISGEAAWQRHSEGLETSVSAIDGKSRLVSFRSIPSLPLVVSVSLEESAVLGDWRKSMLERIAIMAVVTAIALTLGFRLIGNWKMLAASNRDVRTLNEELERKMDVINRQLEEKEVLIKETNHRVKNHMTQLISIIDLSTPPDAGEAFEAIKARIYGYCVLYDKLSYQSDPSGQIEVAGYTRDLVARLIEVSSGQRSVVHCVKVEEGLVPAKTCSALGLILSELVMNSIKHSHCGDAVLAIDIEVGRSGDGRMRVVYSDNGEGFDFEAVRADPENEHIGMILIETMLSQYRGTISYSRDRGSRFEITM